MTTSKVLVAFLAAGSLMFAGCGESSSGSKAAGASGNGADRAFVADMVPHHQSAIAMAKIAQKRARSAFVKQLAANIIASQAEEIATMRAEDEGLATAGVKKGSLGVPGSMMGMDHDPAMLKSATSFDKAFMEMMIPHHQGAVVMANAELKRGSDPQLKTLAQNIITAQQREIAAMRKQLGTAPPAGHSMKSMNHGAG
jgi:uncharacterized protein (DUF305 family)